jgi:hypothetical protein
MSRFSDSRVSKNSFFPASARLIDVLLALAFAETAEATVIKKMRKRQKNFEDTYELIVLELQNEAPN